MDVADSAFELLTNALSSDECKFSSLLAENIDETNMVGVSMDTSSGGPYKVRKQSHHFGNDHNV